jgi:hypothetical protein
MYSFSFSPPMPPFAPNRISFRGKGNIFAAPCVGPEVAAVSQPLSLVRRGAALASMLGASAIIAVESVHPWRTDWIGMTWAAMLAVGGLGITAKHLTLQTLSRGMAWVMAAPTALVVGIEAMSSHRIDWPVAALFAATSSALLLARPQLHTKEAREQFHPHRFRKTLIAGSTATAATAYLTGGIALELFRERGLVSGSALAFSLLTVTLLAIATAVVRMRAWGILLGAATSAILLVVAAFLRHEEGMALALLSLPMMVLHLMPILLARWVPAAPENVRVSASSLRESAPVRYRVATLEDEIDAAIDADREELPQERRKVHV